MGMKVIRPRYPASQRQKRHRKVRRYPVRLRFVLLLTLCLGLAGFSSVAVRY